ncbi:hypothetical protein PYW07_012750 [Mythimna separata]|uniref:Uncharacterized protein n=1 Tax=Mythimna separata TaxID=271217 RepID=A0AAD8DLL5_MYTSE|nr:hypothetical protein PYW07_012750 [Mythimna separata]
MNAVKSVDDDEVRQVSKFASMIEFVNKVYESDDGTSDFFRRRRPSKHKIFRRLDKAVSPMNDEVTKSKLDKMVDSVRYHIIKNPEVLVNYKNKQKKKDAHIIKNPEVLVNYKNKQKKKDALRKSLVIVNTSDTKSSSTAESKLDDIPTQIEPATVLKDDVVTTANPKVILQNDSALHIRAKHDDYDQINDKTTYRPSFPDEDDDDEKQNTESINLKINKKEDVKPKTDKNHEDTLEITNQNSEALDKKMKAGIDKNKADTTEKTNPVQNEYSDRRDERHSLWIKVDGKNDDDGEGDREEKWDNNHDQWSKNERELDDKFDKWIKIDENKVNNDGSRSKTGNTNDRYNEENNDWDKEKELDKSNEKWIKNDKVRVNNEGNWSDREKNRNRNIDKYSNRDKDYVDKYSNRDNDWDKNDDKAEKDRYKIMDQNGHTEKWFDKMEYEWNKRHENFDKNAKYTQFDTGYQSNQNGKDFNERDNEYKKRDNEWTKTDDNRHKKHDRTYIDDKKISGNQYSDEQNYERRHDRYKIVGRNSKDRSRDYDSQPSVSPSFSAQNARKYNVEEEAIKLYKQDFHTVLKRFRRTPAYQKILEDKLKDLTNEIGDRCLQVLHFYHGKMEKRVEDTLPAKSNGMNEKPPEDKDKSSRMGLAKESPPPHISEDDWNKIQSLDNYDMFHLRLTVAERNTLKEMGFSFAGQVIHSIINSVKGKGNDTKNEHITKLPFGGEIGSTATEHPENHQWQYITEADENKKEQEIKPLGQDKHDDHDKHTEKEHRDYGNTIHTTTGLEINNAKFRAKEVSMNPVTTAKKPSTSGTKATNRPTHSKSQPLRKGSPGTTRKVTSNVKLVPK